MCYFNERETERKKKALYKGRSQANSMREGINVPKKSWNGHAHLKNDYGLFDVYDRDVFNEVKRGCQFSIIKEPRPLKNQLWLIRSV